MKAVVILILFLFPFAVTAQESYKNTIFFEAMGTALIYSVNYERITFFQNEIQLASRIGLCFYRIKHSDYRDIRLPLSLSMLKGGNRKAEVRVSIAPYVASNIHKNASPGNPGSPVYVREYEVNHFPVAIGIGYRYMSPGNGLFFNALFQLHLSEYFNYGYNNLSFGIGYSF